MSEDAQLIDQTLAGDPTAYGRLVRKYQDRLYTTLVHVSGSREDAEDVTQEAFVKAFTKLDSFQGRSAFFTWLYRIAFNMSVSKQRRKRPEVSVEATREAIGVEPVEDIEAPDQRIERQERAIQVNAALRELSDEHRAVIILREMEDCDYETIAEILKLPVGTVRSRLHRARSQMRDLLKGVLQENL